MDDGRCDGLTRTIGERRSRRAAAGLVASGALSGLLGRVGSEEATAKKRKKKPQPCKLQCPAGMVATRDICVTGQGTCGTGDDTCGLLPSTRACNNARLPVRRCRRQRRPLRQSSHAARVRPMHHGQPVRRLRAGGVLRAFDQQHPGSSMLLPYGWAGALPAAVLARREAREVSRWTTSVSIG